MLGTIVALLLILGHGRAQLNTSCVQLVDGTAADASPYSDNEPSLTFTMAGVTDVQENTVSFVKIRAILSRVCSRKSMKGRV